MKYRIKKVQYNGVKPDEFYIQYKCVLFWLTHRNLYGDIVTYDSIEDAREIIKYWLSDEKAKKKISYEYIE